ncbi:hypothetical protein G7Y89_g14335 [Cudoniella acicularis]|uniref:Uncharacterized protein n=1 Tax=Cudoniella acicularis TaxID=354080 RepID=A0A8H4VUH3_9HELO|nr:hypothetical protein G7Y89_g14335 [Cudoniella acicularis]
MTASVTVALDTSRGGAAIAEPEVQKAESQHPCQPPENTEVQQTTAHSVKADDDTKQELDDDKESSGWKWSAYRRLTRIVIEAKGAASEQVVKFIKRQNKVDFCGGTVRDRENYNATRVDGIGSQGWGDYEIRQVLFNTKFVLLSLATSNTFSWTRRALAQQTWKTSRIFLNIINCLTALGPFVTIAGLIFVFGSPNTRMMAHDAKTAQWVQCFCGPKFYRNIIFVTNKWDEYNKKAFEKAWERVGELISDGNVKQILDPPGRYHGGSLYHHGLPGGKRTVGCHGSVLCHEENGLERGKEFEKLILKCYSKTEPAELQVISELNNGTPPLETEAAKALKAQPFKTQILIHEDRAVVSTTIKVQPVQVPQIQVPKNPNTPTPKPSAPETSAASPQAPPPKTPTMAEAGTPEPPNTNAKASASKPNKPVRPSWIENFFIAENAEQ